MPEDNNKESHSSSELKAKGVTMPTSQEMVGCFNGQSYNPNLQGSQKGIPNINIPPELIQQLPPVEARSSNHESLKVGLDKVDNPYAVIPGAQVNVRAANAAVLNGQPIEGRKVYWQFNNENKSHFFWQMFDEDTAMYWDAIGQKISLTCKKENGDIIDLNGANLGSKDDLSVWVPQYRQLTTLEILIENEFPSIKPQEMFSLITLASHADPSGIISDITIRQLSDLTGYSKDTALRHIDSLKRSKIIKETSRISKLKKKGQLQEKQVRSYKILLGEEVSELDGISFNQLEDRMS